MHFAAIKKAWRKWYQNDVPVQVRMRRNYMYNGASRDFYTLPEKPVYLDAEDDAQ
jgi:hypothetical protein